MKFKRLLISLTLSGGSLFLPISRINKQVGAGEVVALPMAETTTKNPTYPMTSVYLEKSSSIETKVLATRLVLNLKERKVYAYQNDKLLASYRVAIGKKGWETPEGLFEVIQMIENPGWENPWNGKVSAPGANSPLGERWIGFWTNGKDYIGFHGTSGEHLIGQAVSHGCVRMRNADVKSLFELVGKGIPVVVRQ